MTRLELGLRGEEMAVALLESQGLEVLNRNWRTRHGELDIVARDAEELVFCEVKTRTGAGFGTPAEAVTPAKARRIRQLALQWLAATGEHAPLLRFDVVAVLSEPSGVLVHHLRGAF